MIDATASARGTSALRATGWVRRVAVAAALLAATACSGTGCKRSGTGDALGEDRPLRVAAAADLQRAFTDIGDAFAAKGHPKPVFSFGSTGLLAKQIEEGAPFDVFAAANVSFVDDVTRAGRCDGSTRALYARGRIVLWSRPGLSDPPKSLAELSAPRFSRISIANPEHAPYGRAAIEAMKTDGVYDALKGRLVFGENVQQALQFASTGNADVAIVALSIADAPGGGSWVPVDPQKHVDIDQALVVCAKAPHVAKAGEFTAFVNSDEGRAIMKKYGFVLPGESVLGSAGPK
ncbi:MAG: molybdate ABC transporter substrate-binding protein [Polyangiaceae bacterium]